MSLQLLQLVMVVLLPHLTDNFGAKSVIKLCQASQTAAGISHHAGSRRAQGLRYTSARLTIDRKLLTVNTSDTSKELFCDEICRVAQREALSQLFFAWNGRSWTRRANWTQDNVSICHWEGVWCCLPAGVDVYDPASGSAGNNYACPGSNEVVLGLNLRSNNISGALAAVPWSNLSLSLKFLHLDENRLTGDLTPLAPLFHLQHLSLAANLLNGTLKPLSPDPDPTAPPSPSPSELQAIPTPTTAPLLQLISLLLSHNQLSGELPRGLLRHPTLQVLDLGNNFLSGGVPTELLSGPYLLQRVVLAGNRLRGRLPALPTAVQAAGSLTYLDLSHNQLGGPLDPLLPAGPALKHLALQNNSFNGSLPGGGAQLQHLDLSWNALSGTLPPTLGPHLATLLLLGNSRLTGPLPPGLTGLTSLNLMGTALQATQPGAAGLPTYLVLSDSAYITHSPGPSGALCPQLIFRSTGQAAAVSPYYWQFDSCICQSGYTVEYTRTAASAAPLEKTAAPNAAGDSSIEGRSTTPTVPTSSSSSSSSPGPVVDVSCVVVQWAGGSAGSFPWWVALLATAAGLALAGVLLRLARQLAPSVERYRAAMARRMPPGFGRRAAGCQVTLVLTDVEGSTELWEWDTDVMATAIELHDHTLRSTLPKWQGYEVQTEGDAFLVAFHEPADALGWCISTQLVLLNADWDPELFRHRKAAIETSDSLLASPHTNPMLAFSNSFSCIEPTAQLISPLQRPLAPQAPSALPQHLHHPSNTAPQSHPHPHPPPQSAPLVRLSGAPAAFVRPIRPLTQLGGQKVGLSTGVSPASGPGMLASSEGSFTHQPPTGMLLGGGSRHGGAGDGGLRLANRLGLSLEFGPEGSGGSGSEAQEDSGSRGRNGRNSLDHVASYRGRANTAAAITVHSLQSEEPQVRGGAAAAAAAAEATIGTSSGGGGGRGGPAALATTFSGAFASVMSGGETGGLMVGASSVSLMDPCRAGHMMPLDARPTACPDGGSGVTLQGLLQGTATHGSTSHDWCRFTRLGVQYRGLRVRMGVATGAADALRPHAVTQKVEYYGEVRRRLQAVADLPHGGQILIDAATFNSTHNKLTDLSTRLQQVVTRTAKNARSFRPCASPAHSPDHSPFPSYTVGHSPHTHGGNPSAAGLGLTTPSGAPGKGPMGGLMRWASLGRPAASLELSRRPSSRHPLDLATAPEPLTTEPERGPGSSGVFLDSGVGAVGPETWWDGAGSVAAVGQRLVSAWRMVRPPSVRRMSMGHCGGGGGGGGATATEEVPTLRAGAGVHRPGFLPLATTPATPVPALAIAHPLIPSALSGQYQRNPRPAPTSGHIRQQPIIGSPPLPPSSLPPIIQNVVSDPPPPPPYLQHQPSQLDGSSHSHQPQQLLPCTTSLTSQHRFVPRRMLGGFSSVDRGAVAAAVYGSNVEASAAAQAAVDYSVSMLAAYGSSAGGGRGADSTEVGDGSLGAGCSTLNILGVVSGTLGPAAVGVGRGGVADGVGLDRASMAHPVAVVPYTRKFSFDGHGSGQDPTGTLPSHRHHPRHHHHHHHYSYNYAANHHRQPPHPHHHPHQPHPQPPSASLLQVPACAQVSGSAGVGTRGGGTCSFSEQDSTLPLTFVPEGQLTRRGSRETPSTTPASACVTYPLEGAPAVPSFHPGGLAPSGNHTPVGPPLAASNPHPYLREAPHTYTGRRGSAVVAVGIMAMGVFELHAGNSVEYISLTQVLVPGLEERARLSPPLDGSRQLTPGYLDAPAAVAAPLGLRAPKQTPLPPVAVVFCSLERYPEMVAVSRDLSYDVLAVYNDVVRRSLLACGGYECQEQEGHFMVAFGRPGDALEWCLMLQELVMEVAWTTPMLCLPGMQEQRHALTGAMLFRGPRVKAGLYAGVPTRVGPHPTTGRADYYGPLVNRAARFCHAAAQGGQVIVARYLLEDILREDLQLMTQATATVTATTATSTNSTTTAATATASATITTPTSTAVSHSATGPPPGLSPGFGPSTSSGSGKAPGPRNPTPTPGDLPLRRSADLGNSGGGGGGGSGRGGLLEAVCGVVGAGHRLPRPQDIPPEALPLRLVAVVDNSGVAPSRWRMPADAAASSVGGGGGGAGACGGGGGSSAADHDDNGEVIVMGDHTAPPLAASRTHHRTSHNGLRRRAAFRQHTRRPSGCVASMSPPPPPPSQPSPQLGPGDDGRVGSGIVAATGSPAAAATASLELTVRGNSRHHHRTRGTLAAGASSHRMPLVPRPQSCSGLGPPERVEHTPSCNRARGGFSGSGFSFGGGGGGGGGFSASAGSHLKRTGSHPMLHTHAVTSAAVGTAGGGLAANGRAHSALVVQGTGKSSSTLAVPSVSSVAASILSAAPTLRRSGSFRRTLVAATADLNAVGVAFNEEEVPLAEVVLYNISPTSVPPIMRPLLEAAIAAVVSMSPQPTARGCCGSVWSGGERSSPARGGGGGGTGGGDSGEGGEQHMHQSLHPHMLLQQPSSNSFKHQPNQPALCVSPSPRSAAGLSGQSQMLRLLLSGSSMMVGSGNVPAAAPSPTALPVLRPSGRSTHTALRCSSTVLYDSVSHGLPKLPESCIRQRTGPFRWLWALELMVEDLGLFRFKGVAGAHHLVSVSTAATSERRAGPRLHTAKGERVEPGRGPLYRVVLQAAQTAENNDLVRV